jgi:hypothetical protein
MTQPIWYDSTEAGAPTLNNVAGSLLEVLRSCLVTGFNAKTVTSIAVASGVATATCAAHGFLSTYGKLVQIAGAPEALLNGNQQPLAVDTNTFTFAAPGVADGAYTGTISARRAPLGWVEAHTGTNVAIFGRSVPEATAMRLRVDDTASPSALFARVRMVESASSTGDFLDPSPTEAQVPGGGFWPKGPATTAAKRWVLIGDDRFIWLATEHPSGDFNGYDTVVNVFGDPASFGQVDPYLCMLGSGTDSVTNISAFNLNRGFGLGQQDSIGASTLVVARYSDGTSKSVPVRPIFNWADGSVFGGAAFATAPSSAQFGLVQTEVLLRESMSGVSRRNIVGAIPGMAVPYFWMEDIKATQPTASVFQAQGRRMVTLLTRAPGTGGIFVSLEQEDWGRA